MGFDISKTLEIAKLAVETCLSPMYEMENEEIIQVRTQVRKIKDARPVEEYLRVQKRFRHLFTMKDEKKISRKSRQWQTGI